MASGTSSSGFDGTKRTFQSKGLIEQIERAVKESLEEGATAMKGMIETRGTGNTWTKAWDGSSRTASIPGRVDSGNMRDSVEGKVTDVSETRVEGVLGWADGSPEYFGYQNSGFRHVLAAKQIPGMMALRDAAELTEQVLVEKLQNMKGL